MFPLFYECSLFNLHIYPLFTFYSSPQVKFNMIYMSKNSITLITFLALENFNETIKSKINYMLSHWCRGLRYSWINVWKNFESANCSRHLRNRFESVLSFKGTCSSRAFLQSCEITDFKTRERQATVIHHTNLYYEKVDLLIIGNLPELFLDKKGSLKRQIFFFTIHFSFDFG